MLFAGGAEEPRDPKLPGQELAGVHYAMPYLVQQNKRVGGEEVDRRCRSSPAASMSW